MLRRLAWIGSFAGVVAVFLLAAVLQEFDADGLPDAARDAGLTLPLQEPRLVASSSRGVLELYDGAVLVRRYAAAFGAARDGRRATPVGRYEVVRKERRKDVLRRGSRALVLNYPDAADADAAFSAGRLSREDRDAVRDAAAAGRAPPPTEAFGGELCVQGGYYFFRDGRFTDGDIALGNDDIVELFEHVPLGTTVDVVD